MKSPYLSFRGVAGDEESRSRSFFRARFLAKFILSEMQRFFAEITVSLFTSPRAVRKRRANGPGMTVRTACPERSEWGSEWHTAWDGMTPRRARFTSNGMAASARMGKMHNEIVAVVANRPLTGGHFLLDLYSPRQAEATRPGQFAMVRLLEHSDVLLRRPMSIYDVMPQETAAQRSANGASPEIIRLLYKIVGRGTCLMGALKPGDRVELLAPLGHGFFEEEYLPVAKAADEVLHVAGGIGIAALLLPARQIAKAGLRQRLFFGGRTAGDLVGAEDFESYVEEMALATENGSKGHHGYVTSPLEKCLADNPKQKFLLMACGPWAMLHATVDLAQRFSQPCLVSMENRMGCGLGVCLGCCIRVEGTGHGAYERVCTEGPVFRAEKVIWEREEIPKI
jgi:dihydroorotate dehydrogenase electron transfer subunit